MLPGIHDTREKTDKQRGAPRGSDWEHFQEQVVPMSFSFMYQKALLSSMVVWEVDLELRGLRYDSLFT